MTLEELRGHILALFEEGAPVICLDCGIRCKYAHNYCCTCLRTVCAACWMQRHPPCKDNSREDVPYTKYS